MALAIAGDHTAATHFMVALNGTPVQTTIVALPPQCFDDGFDQLSVIGHGIHSNTDHTNPTTSAPTSPTLPTTLYRVALYRDRTKHPGHSFGTEGQSVQYSATWDSDGRAHPVSAPSTPRQTHSFGALSPRPRSPCAK